MNPRLPVLVLAATIAVLAAAAFFARKTPAPRPLPPAVAKEVDVLRQERRRTPDIPAGGVGYPEYAKRLDVLRAAPEPDLRALEDVVLNRREDPLLRIDLLSALRPGDFARQLLVKLVSDPGEPLSLRIAALSALGQYPDPHTLDTLRALWRSDFEARYHVVVALGDCRQPGAVPLLREALGTSQALDVRSHAALALGNYPEALEDLIRLSKEDVQLTVRENALRALARSASPEAERALRESKLPLAEALLKERATSSPPERKGR